MALQSVDNGFQSLHLSLRRLERIDPTGLIEDECAERIDVIGEVRFGEHEPIESVARKPVNRTGTNIGSAECAASTA
jgi:hypothetical protein